MSSPKKFDQETSKSTVIEMLKQHAFDTSVGNSECLDEVRCSSLLHGKIPDAERESIESHLVTCQDCLDLVTDLVTLQREANVEVAPDLMAAALAMQPRRLRAVPVSNFGWPATLAAAASLILGVGIVFWQFDEASDTTVTAAPAGLPTGEDSAVRIIIGHDQERLDIASPVANASIDPKDFFMRWAPVERSIFYEVQLLSDDGDVVWEGRTEDITLQLPPDLQLEAGGGYFVWAKAYLPDGKTINSQAVLVQIEDSGPQ